MISGWRLELPDDYQQFDYETITDVILHIQYTARDGGDAFKKNTKSEVKDSLSKIADILASSTSGLTRIVSAAHEFSGEWHKFLYPKPSDDSHVLKVTLQKRLFSSMFRNKTLEVKDIVVPQATTVPALRVVMVLANPSLYKDTKPLSVTVRMPDESEMLGDLKIDAELENQPDLTSSTSFELADTEKQVTITASEQDVATIPSELVEIRDGKSRLNPAQVKDILLVLTYKVK